MRSLSAATKDPARAIDNRLDPQPVVSVLVSFTPVRHRSPVAALIVFAQARTLADGGAQYSKACEGATLPWVQIPPPPPLTCKNVGLRSRQAGFLTLPWAPWLSQLRAARGPGARISCSCCAWSQTRRTGPNGEAHAGKACALPFRAGRTRRQVGGYFAGQHSCCSPPRLAAGTRARAAPAGNGQSASLRLVRPW